MAKTSPTPDPNGPPASNPRDRHEPPAAVVVVLAVLVQLATAVARGARRTVAPRLAAGARVAAATTVRLAALLWRGASAGAGRAWRRLRPGLASLRARLHRWWRRWSAEVALAAPPLQEDALAGWHQVVRTDVPELLHAALRPVVLRAGRAAGAGMRRLAPAVAAAALLAWFAPGPALQAAASFTSVGDPLFRPLPRRTLIVSVDGVPLGVVHGGQNRRVVPLGAVPPLVRRLVVLAEDRRFLAHDGFDKAAIVRATVSNGRAGAIRQGASTITQQLVKRNLVGDDRTPWRKVRELVLAVAAERQTTKSQLLARYLNEVYFGAGAYGIAAAAETYFGIPVDRLRPEQAALLAALIRAPSSLDPWRRPGPVRARRNLLLRAAGDAGSIDRRAVGELTRRDLGLLDGPSTAPVLDRDLVSAVEREIASRPELGPDPASRVRRFRSGGWTVETTISPAVQEAARAAVAARLSAARAPGAAVAVVEPGTGRIRALYSRRPPELAKLELASSGRRQPGSAFKPLAAIAALQAGLDPSQPLEGRSGVTFDLGRERWEVDNFGGQDHRGVDLAKALQDSVNTAFAQIGVAVGAGRLADVAARLGIDAQDALGPPSTRGPAIALGGTLRGVTPLELAGAYAALANDGNYVAPTLIERIRDARGHEVLALRPQARPAVDPAVDARVRSMLQGVVTAGTGTRAALDGWAPFGKTGTSQDRADAWFVGAVPSLAAAVWVGDPRGRVPMPDATGGTVAAPVWRDVMARALQDRQPVAFPSPGPLAQPAGLALPRPVVRSRR